MSSLHARAKALFLEALERPAEGRAAFLAEAAGADEALREEVLALLACHSGSDGDTGPPTTTLPAGTADRFAPGDVFAGRYRMITRLGRGGMGDLWRADDLVVDTPVALKLIRAGGPGRREALLNEVRLARQITHPAVCRVFDVGVAEEEVFLSMELVQGEDLAALLRRVSRLPSEKVLDIARQLCAGVAAAHDRQVLHRDLKPANVLIDEDGLVKITDFGIATTAGAARAGGAGTPAYMAPEQATQAGPLTERTDIYALGLVLYELVTGRHAFGAAASGRDVPLVRPSALVPGVDPGLERAIVQALSRDPARRPASARALASLLPPETEGVARAATRGTEPTTRAGTRRTAGFVVAIAAALAVIGGTLVLMRPQAAGALTARDTIILADVLNTTGDPVFDGTLHVALAVALEQSPFIRVFPDERVQETLRLMQRPPDEPITRAVAREIAQRAQLKALIAGSIASLGRNYVLAVEAIDARTGDVMAREQVEATGKEEVLTALGAAAVRLRERLGESLPSLQRFDVPLPQATTPSLEALQAYARALDRGRAVPRLEAIPHLQRALELAPDFAMAMALLSGIYANTSQTALAPELSRRAYELRDRVSERERFVIAWRYHRDATQAWDKALELARTWTATYPREPMAFNSLGIAAMRFGQWEQAAEALREAIRLDPKYVTPYANLVQTLVALERIDEARAVLESAEAEQLDLNVLHRWGYLLGFLTDDTAAMARHLAAVRATTAGFAADAWEPRVQAFGGRLASAHRSFQVAAATALQNGFNEVAADWRLEDAEAHAAADDCTVAREDTLTALELSRDNSALGRAARLLAYCDRPDTATAVAAELAERFPESVVDTRILIPLADATRRLRQGDLDGSLEQLERLRPYDHALAADFWPLMVRGQALLALGRGQEAVAAFRDVVAHRGEDPDSPWYPVAHLGLARAAALAGDPATARQAYERLFALWQEADPDLPPLLAARREYAALP
ncbi:MAG: protein kinase [Vicinamibacterales bacterium]